MAPNDVHLFTCYAIIDYECQSFLKGSCLCLQPPAPSLVFLLWQKLALPEPLLNLCLFYVAYPQKAIF